MVGSNGLLCFFAAQVLERLAEIFSMCSSVVYETEGDPGEVCPLLTDFERAGSIHAWRFGGLVGKSGLPIGGAKWYDFLCVVCSVRGS